MKKAPATLRVIAYIQIVLCILLCASAVVSYVVIRSSLGSISKSLSESILASASVIESAAATLHQQHMVISEAGNTLQVSRNVLKEIELAASQQGPLLQQYASSLKSVADITDRIGISLDRFSQALLISVPCSIQWKGALSLPEITYCKPLANLSVESKTNAQDLRNLSVGVKQLANTIGTQAPQLNAAFTTAVKQTSTLMDVMSKSLSDIKLQGLPSAVNDLKKAEINLRDIEKATHGIDLLALCVLGVLFLLAALFLTNSLTLLQLARAREWIDQVME